MLTLSDYLFEKKFINTTTAVQSVTTTARVTSNNTTGEQYVTANTFTIPTTVPVGTTYQMYLDTATAPAFNLPFVKLVVLKAY